MAMAVGVLPAPPSVKLPTQMTGMPAFAPGCSHARRGDGAIDQCDAVAAASAGRDALSHQKDGSRIGRPVFEPQLQEIGFERRDRAIERAAEPLDGFLAGVARRFAGSRDPSASRRCAGQIVDIRHFGGAARRIERGVDFREIRDMRTVQDGGAELDRLDRILSAMLDERAAHEDDRRERVDQARVRPWCRRRRSAVWRSGNWRCERKAGTCPARSARL